MAGKKLELGPIGNVVAENVKRFRGVARFNYTELSVELAKYGRDISPLAVRRIEEGNRRVDVDDLAALALSLGISPLALLLPIKDGAVTPEGETYTAQQIWQWGQGSYPLISASREPSERARPSDLAFVINSNPFGGNNIAAMFAALKLPDDLAETVVPLLPWASVTADDSKDSLTISIDTGTGGEGDVDD